MWKTTYRYFDGAVHTVSQLNSVDLLALIVSFLRTDVLRGGPPSTSTHVVSLTIERDL